MQPTETNWRELSAEEKKRQLFLNQKELLLLFLEKRAITEAQFQKSYGDLCRKMGFKEEH